MKYYDQDFTPIPDKIVEEILPEDENYAEHYRKAIAAATPKENPLTVHLNSTRFTVNDEEMLKRLAGLK